MNFLSIFNVFLEHGFTEKSFHATMGLGCGKQKSWKISFHRLSSNLLPIKKEDQTQSSSIPIEFLCPLSNSIMADPVIVSSGHTFERSCVQACVLLSFKPILPCGIVPDFTTFIPNLALKSTILNWCRRHLIDPPDTIDCVSAQNIVRRLMNKFPDDGIHLPNTELPWTPSEMSVTSTEESVTPRNGLTTPLPPTTGASCCSSSSSCDNEILGVYSLEEENFIIKLESSQVFEQEEGLIALRSLTRTREEIRAHLCTPQLLSALKSLISSRYSSLQVNAVAALVNLSLEKQNKVKIVRSGIVPPLIDILKGGFSESQDHAAGALFSLALDDQNKIAIGVLGALPPLLHALNSTLERTRHDSALALYHLSLVQSNQIKMIKTGSVQMLLGMAKLGHLTDKILLVLCNMTASMEGRVAMLAGGAVECFVSILSQGKFDSAATRESCLAALYGLSYGGLRFKGLAKEAGAVEVLRTLEEKSNEREIVKVRRILQLLRDKDKEIDWKELLN